MSEQDKTPFMIEDEDFFESDPSFMAAVEDADARHRLLSDLVRQRKAAGLTQKDVARKMSTTQSTVSALESGRTDPHLSTLQRYARAVTAKIALRVELPAVCDWAPRDSWVPAGGRYSKGRVSFAAPETAREVPSSMRQPAATATLVHAVSP